MSFVGFLLSNISKSNISTALGVVEQHGGVQQFGKFWHYSLLTIMCYKLLGPDRNALAHTAR